MFGMQAMNQIAHDKETASIEFILTLIEKIATATGW